MQQDTHLDKKQKNLSETQEKLYDEKSKSDTPNKSARVNRIFKETPRQSSQFSPVSPVNQYKPPVQNSTINTSRMMKSVSPQTCVTYYKEGYTSTSPSMIQNIRSSLSPEKMKLVKSTQLLQYENELLRKQLQQQLDIINMYKKGYSPSTLPINDSLVSNLNLKLAQKNVLIQQIHRNLIQFHQIILKQKIQISPVCKQRFKILMDLIMSHQHYPIIISERVANTKRDAQRIYIRQDKGHQWHLKMEQSYKQLTTIKQKLDWFQRQNNVLQNTIAGLKAHKDIGSNNQINIYKIEIQKLTNQIIMLQQDTSNYKFQINTMLTSIQDLKKQAQHANLSASIPPIAPSAPTQTYTKQQYQALQSQITSIKKQRHQAVLSLTQRFEKLQIQLNNTSQKQSSLLLQINRLKAQIPTTQSNKKYTQQQMSLKVQQIHSLILKIGQFDRVIQLERNRVKQLQRDSKISNEQKLKWKKHCEQAQNYIQELMKKINELQTKTNQNSAQNNDNNKLIQQNSRLSQQISSLFKKIQQLQKQAQSASSILQSLQLSKSKLLDYQALLSSLNLQLEQQRTQSRATISKMTAQNAMNVQQIQIKIRRQYQVLISEQRMEIQKKIRKQFQSKNKNVQNDLRKQIQRLNQEIRNMKRQKNNRDWQTQIKNIRQGYEIKLKQSHMQLSKAEEYIQSSSRTSQYQIKSLKSSLTTLQTENEQLKRSSISNKDEYLYKVDSRYSQIQQKLIQLSKKSNQSIVNQSQFWQRYKKQKKTELQQTQLLINQILSIIGNVQQTIIIKREQLHRLDFLKLQQIIQQMNKVKKQRKQLDQNMRKQIQTKFYGVLRTISTTISL